MGLSYIRESVLPNFKRSRLKNVMHSPKNIWSPAPVVEHAHQPTLIHDAVTKLFAITSLWFSGSSVLILCLLQAPALHTVHQAIQIQSSLVATIVVSSPCIGLISSLLGWRHRVGKIGFCLAVTILAVYLFWPTFH